MNAVEKIKSGKAFTINAIYHKNLNEVNNMFLTILFKGINNDKVTVEVTNVFIVEAEGIVEKKDTFAISISIFSDCKTIKQVFYKILAYSGNTNKWDKIY